jgi:hypothetical protein
MERRMIDDIFFASKELEMWEVDAAVIDKATELRTFPGNLSK